MTDPGIAPRPGAPRHETRDIDARRLAVLSVLLAAIVVVAMVLMFWTFDYFAAREAGRQPRPATRHEVRFPPEPRLQVSGRDDLARLRVEEDAILGAYGWSDRENGVVRIPIERAMELAVERGLPAREQVTP